jgi:hypothetical protein
MKTHVHIYAYSLCFAIQYRKLITFVVYFDKKMDTSS